MSFTAKASETAYGTNAVRAVDGLTTASYKAFSLFNNKLDGTYLPLNSPAYGGTSLTTLSCDFEECSGTFYGDPAQDNGQNSNPVGGGWYVGLHHSSTTDYCGIMTDGGISGNRYARIYNTDSSWKAFVGSGGGIAFDNYPGKWFRFSVWCRVSGVGFAGGYLNYTNGGPCEVYRTRTFTPEEYNKWFKLEGTMQVPANPSPAWGLPFLYGHNADGFTDYDCYKIEGPFDTDPGASKVFQGWWSTSRSDNANALLGADVLPLTGASVFGNAAWNKSYLTAVSYTTNGPVAGKQVINFKILNGINNGFIYNYNNMAPQQSSGGHLYEVFVWVKISSGALTLDAYTGDYSAPVRAYTPMQTINSTDGWVLFRQTIRTPIPNPSQSISFRMTNITDAANATISMSVPQFRPHVCIDQIGPRTMWNIQIHSDTEDGLDYPTSFRVDLIKNNTIVHSHVQFTNTNPYYYAALPQAYDVDRVIYTFEATSRPGQPVRLTEILPDFVNNRSDQLALALSEQSLAALGLYSTDTWTPKLQETSGNTAELSRIDTWAPKLQDDSFMVQRETWSSDQWPVAITEAKNVTVQLASADTLLPKLSEAKAVTANLFRDDSLLISGALEADGLTADFGSSDTWKLSLAEQKKLDNIYSAMDSAQRQVFAKVEITYSDPFKDESLTYTASETGRFTYAQQVFDNVTTPAYRWFALHDNKLDGSRYPLPSSKQYSVGWWSTSVSDASGYMTTQPTITLTFSARSITTLRVVGDSQADIFPADFRIDAYNVANSLIFTHTVTGNTDVNWLYLPGVIPAATKMTLTITRVNKPGVPVRIMELFTVVREVYEADMLQSIHLLEEIGYSTGNIPIGNMSANEVDIAISNADRRFDLDNAQSPLYGYIKRNRRVQVWMGSYIGDYDYHVTSVDASDTSVTLSGGTWSVNGAAYECTSADSKVSFVFTGCGVRIYSNKGTAYGTQDVFIDGTYIQTINANTNALQTGVLVADITGLHDGAHVLELKNTSTSTASIDRFEVITRTPVDGIEWSPRGVYWTTAWDISSDSLTATLTARDRLELLRQTDFTTSTVYVNYNLKQLFELILLDAGLLQDEFELDEALTTITLPYAWFPKMSHRQALQRLAGCAVIQVYCTETGIVRVNLNLDATPTVMYHFDDDTNINTSKYPLAVAEQVNYVAVTSKSWAVGATEQLFDSSETFTIPANSTKKVTYEFNTVPVMSVSSPVLTASAGISVKGTTLYAWGILIEYQNTTGTQGSVTHVTINGQPLKETGKQVYVAQDAAGIFDDGKISSTLEHDFIQGGVYAQQLADVILATYKNSRHDVTLDSRGNTALRLADQITVNDSGSFMVARQNIQWVGYLQATVEGKKL